MNFANNVQRQRSNINFAPNPTKFTSVHRSTASYSGTTMEQQMQVDGRLDSLQKEEMSKIKSNIRDRNNLVQRGLKKKLDQRLDAFEQTEKVERAKSQATNARLKKLKHLETRSRLGGLESLMPTPEEAKERAKEKHRQKIK